MAKKKNPVQDAVALLRSHSLTIEERNLLTTTVLNLVGAVPIRARIILDGSGGIVSVDGKRPTPALARRLKSSSQALLSNFARKYIQETIDFLAIKQGVHQNINPEQGLFAKAILWQHNEERILLDAMSSIQEVEE